MSASLGQALKSCSSMHRMLCAREFSYREFSIRPNTGIIQRFRKGEIFSISSRSMLINEREEEELQTKHRSDCAQSYSSSEDNTKSLYSLFLQAHWAPKQHLQKALQKPLVTLMDVQLVGQQWEAMVFQELLLLFLVGSAEVCIQQLGKTAQIWHNETGVFRGILAF